MKPPFSYETIFGPFTGSNYRIRDADDNRVATCWTACHAQEIVRLLNVAVAAERLAGERLAQGDGK